MVGGGGVAELGIAADETVRSGQRETAWPKVTN
jgi:hypothetical protein